jgi:S-adenosylmethionine:tRNA ribosyltransferase-isomerase
VTEKTKHSSDYLMLKDFSFEVPEAQVAQHPLSQRDSSRLLIWQNNEIIHSQIKNLADAVPEGSLIIVNNSRVIASRLHGKLATGGAVEILLLEPDVASVDKRESWLALGKPMRKLGTGTKVYFDADLTATITKESPTESSGPHPFTVELSLSGEDLLGWLDQHGEMPLPPYISRKDSTESTKAQDKERYQTVYAQGAGSVAAPTAGLHISKEVMANLAAKNCQFSHVTLHVGAGTFLPVKADDPAKHVMHSERFMVPHETIRDIERARAENRRIIVVGTTALRSLEGLMNQARHEGVKPETLAGKWLRTDIFIRPKSKEDRHKPWCADALMTNFHQPESTLFMLICTLVGYDNAHRIYRRAVDDGYRFFSYGDSSLLWL